MLAALTLGGCALPHHGRGGDAGTAEDGVEADATPVDDAAEGGGDDGCALVADLPDAEGQDTNCDGIDGDASRAVFVSTTGNDANRGTRAQPLATLRAAFARVTGSGGALSQVIVFHGEYDARVDVPSGVSVAGGYCDEATRDLVRCATTLSTPMPDAVRIARASHVLLEGLAISSGDATTAGDSSVALRVMGGDDITLSRVETQAGRGANGADAMPGPTGAAGGTGANGNRRSPAGAGGASTCGAGAGGAGGDGGSSSAAGSAGSGGTAGASVGVTAGGAAGGRGNAFAGGGDGSAGASGTEGAHGVPLASPLSLGVDGAGTYRPIDGTPGLPGGHGAGGGGGGGGGSSTFYDAGSGGGGGAGGCGGDGGGGGTGGGGSFGIIIVGARAVHVTGCVFRADDGGAGGAGSTGAVGGSGGGGGARAGGDGGLAGAGGNGGAGGAGGPGGCGTGGVGGPSVGAVFSGAEILTSEFTAHEAMAGAGGSGPTCVPAASLQGPAGITASQLTM